MKDNQLIAQFMWEHSIVLDASDTKYHESWDWLMPVVEKIMDISFFNGEPDDFYHIRNSIPQIRNTYKAVVEFIKLYNNED